MNYKAVEMKRLHVKAKKWPKILWLLLVLVHLSAFFYHLHDKQFPYETPVAEKELQEERLKEKLNELLHNLYDSKRIIVNFTDFEGEQYVNKNLVNFSFLLNKPDLCPSASRVSLLFGVVSSTRNFEARNLIRQTWGSCRKFSKIKLVFLLGDSKDDDVNEKIVEEDQIHGDIVQGNFIDTYSNLTLKSLMLVKWSMLHCITARFIIKVDDDVYVNTSNLITVLLKYTRKERILIGRKVEKSPVIRDPKSKFYIPVEIYKDKFYPTYLNGPAYVMTQDTLLPLYERALQTDYVPMEDAFITGICTHNSTLQLIHAKEMNADPIRSFDVCSVYWRAIVHHVSKANMKRLWEIQIANKKCLNLKNQ